METSTIRTELKDHGFAPGIVVSSTRPEFDVDELRDALVNGTYTNPDTIPFRLSALCTARVAIDLLRADHPAVESPGAAMRHGAIVYKEVPNWYAEGWIQKRTQRVRLYVICGDEGEILEVCLQVVTDTPQRDDTIHAYSVDED